MHHEIVENILMSHARDKILSNDVIEKVARPSIKMLFALVSSVVATTTFSDLISLPKHHIEDLIDYIGDPEYYLQLSDSQEFGTLLIYHAANKGNRDEVLKYQDLFDISRADKEITLADGTAFLTEEGRQLLDETVPSECGSCKELLLTEKYSLDSHTEVCDTCMVEYYKFQVKNRQYPFRHPTKRTKLSAELIKALEERIPKHHARQPREIPPSQWLFILLRSFCFVSSLTFFTIFFLSKFI
jgi:hypothetical protein